MIPSFEARHAAGGVARKHGWFDFMSGGDDSSTTATTTNNQETWNTLNDSRSVSAFDDHSVQSFVDLANSGNTTTTTNSGNTVLTNVGNSGNAGAINSGNTGSFNTSYSSSTTVTDYGAIAAGQAVAVAGMKQNSTNYDALLGTADNLFAETKKTTDANLMLAGSLSSGARQAYSDAVSQSTGNKTILYVALAAVVCVVGLAMLKR